MENLPDFAVLDNLMEGCQIIGFDWRYLYVNDAAARHGQKPKEELLGRTMMEVYPGIEKTPLFSTLKQCLNERKPAELENEFTYEGGSTAWFLLKINPVPAGLLILSIDISDHKCAEARLRASEEHYRRLVDNAPVGVYQASLDGTILSANPELARMLNFDTPADLIGTCALARYKNPNDHARLLELLQQEKQVRNFQVDVLTRDGQIRTALLSAWLEGNTISGMILDITEHEQTKQHLANLNRLYAILSQINQVIMHAKERDELFQSVCKVAVDVGKVGLAWIGSFEPETGEVTPMLVYGSGQEHLPFETINLREPPFENGLMGAAVRSGKVEYSRDIQNDPNMQHWYEMAVAYGYHSAAAIPLRCKGAICGLLNLYATDVDFFTGDESRNLLEEIGGDISFALDKFDTTEELRESHERFNRLVSELSEIVWTASLDGLHIVDVNDSFEQIYGYSVEDLRRNPRLWLEAVHPEDRAIAEESQKELLSKGSAMVEYRIVRPDGEIRWLWDKKSLIKDARGHPTYVGGIVEDITERKRAEIEALKQISRLEALREIDVAIASSTSLSLTLKTILEQVVTTLSVDAADILLLNPHSQTLEFAAGRGFRTKGIEKTRLRLGQGHAGRAAMEQKTIVTPDLTNPREPFLRASLLQEEDFIFYCVTPLVAKGNLLGVLEVFRRTPFKPDRDWLAFLEALGGQASIAIENSQLFTSLKNATTKLLIAYDETIEGWSRALDLRDKETEGHTLRVTEMTVALARHAGIPEEEIVHLRRGALLHDIGKMGVPDAILLKPDKLTDEEWAIMRKHPVFAYEWLYPIEYLRPALAIPYSHHEKWDGTGYPQGLKGEQIPLPARLFAVVDVYDALSSDRPYRPAWPYEKVMQYIRQQAGSHFDPQVVEWFLQITPPTQPARQA